MPGLNIKIRDTVRAVGITSSPFIIGRGEDCQCHIPSGHVSRKHCEIQQEGDRYSIKDLGSKMGTWLNGRPLDRSEYLRGGDIIKLANRIEIEFCDAFTQPTKTLAGQDKIETGELNRLVGLSGPDAGKEIALYLNLTKVGRASDNHLHIPLETVSSHHAEISRDQNVFIVTDRASANGTFVNGTRITVTRLRGGDVVMFDTASYRFETTSSDEDAKTQKMAAPPDLNSAPPQILANPPGSRQELGTLNSGDSPGWTAQRMAEETIPPKKPLGLVVGLSVAALVGGGTLLYFLARWLLAS